MPGCGSTEPGEGQLLGRGNASPEWLYSFPPVGGNEVSFFHERKKIVTVIQKAVAGNQPHGRKTMRIKNISAAGKRKTQVWVSVMIQAKIDRDSFL